MTHITDQHELRVNSNVIIRECGQHFLDFERHNSGGIGWRSSEQVSARERESIYSALAIYGNVPERVGCEQDLLVDGIHKLGWRQSFFQVHARVVHETRDLVSRVSVSIVAMCTRLFI